MSRIHEALQRATTSHAAGAEDATELPTPLQVPDALAADREAYAAETASAHAATLNVTAAAEALTTHDRPAAPEDPSASRLLLKSIDQRLVEKVVLSDRMEFGSREQYRRLAGTLHDGQETTGLRVVMVASAVAGEGKTLTVANLALTLSESYNKRVLVIDADLRRPSLHQLFGVNTAGGLTEGLEKGGTAKFVVRQLSPTLTVLPAGRPTADPMAALISERMRHLIAEARESYDWVIVDTPPLVLLPDAQLLAAMVDGAVLVVRAESTPHELIRRATDAIGRRRILGVVLNQARTRPNGGYAGYDRYNYYADAGGTE